MPGTMTDIDRRRFMGAGTLGLIGLMPGTAAAARAAPQTVASSSSSEAASDVTRALAGYVVRARPEDLPAAVRIEAGRTLLNWAGCTIGGSQHETGEIAVPALSRLSRAPQATLLRR